MDEDLGAAKPFRWRLVIRNPGQGQVGKPDGKSGADRSPEVLLDAKPRLLGLHLANIKSKSSSFFCESWGCGNYRKYLAKKCVTHKKEVSPATDKISPFTLRKFRQETGMSQRHLVAGR